MLDSPCFVSPTPGSSLRPIGQQNECSKSLVSTLSQPPVTSVEDAAVTQFSPDGQTFGASPASSLAAGQALSSWYGQKQAGVTGVHVPDQAPPRIPPGQALGPNAVVAPTGLNEGLKGDLPVVYAHSVELQEALPVGTLIPQNVRPPQNKVAAGLGPAEIPAMLTGSPFFHAAPAAPQCPSLSPDAPTLACLQPQIETMHMQNFLMEQNRRTDILRPQQQDIQRFMSIQAHKHASGGTGMVQNRFIAQEPTTGFGVITVPNENAMQYNRMMEQMKRELEASGQLTTPNPSGILLHEKLQQERQNGLTEFVEQNNRNAKDAINLTRRWMGLPPLADGEAKNDEPAIGTDRKDRLSPCGDRAVPPGEGVTEDAGNPSRELATPQPQPQPRPVEMDVSSLLVVSGPPPSILRQAAREQEQMLQSEMTLEDQQRELEAKRDRLQAELHATESQLQQGYSKTAYCQGEYTGLVEATGFATNAAPAQQEADEQFQLQRLVEVQNQKISYLEQLLEQKKVEYYSGFSSSVPEYFPPHGGAIDSLAASPHQHVTPEPEVQSAPALAWGQPELAAKAPPKPEQQREMKRQSKKAEAKTASRSASHESAHSQSSKEGDLDEALRRFVGARAALPVERCLRRVQRGVYFLGNVKMLAKRGQNGNILCMAQHAVGDGKVAVGELGKKFVSLERFWAHFCKHLETA